jgi:hypothetical protein
VTPLQPDAHWLAALQARASQPPRAPRLPLLAGAARVGSVEAGFFEKNGLQAAPELREVLQKTEHSGAPAWHLAAPLDASLAALAQALRVAGLAGAWRDELLAVTDEQGTALGVVERAAVRPLGIATRAVHLLARSPDGRHWVQKRALNKANDPGLWDTLMGGTGAAGWVASAPGRIQDGVGDRADVRVDALEVADQVDVQRAGFDALHRVVRQAAQVGGRVFALQVAKAGLFLQQLLASRTLPFRNTLMPRRRLSTSRACSSQISAMPASEKLRPFLIFLSSMSISTRSMMSPICSMLMVKLMMSVQRGFRLAQGLARDLGQVVLDGRVQLVHRVVQLAQVLGQLAGRCP